MYEAYVARKKDAKVYDIPGGSVCTLYADSPVGNLSCAYVETDGRYPAEGSRKNIVCTEATFVIEGSMEFTLGDEKFLLEAGDVIYVPVNVPYTVVGKGRSLVFINPKWDSAQNVAV